MYCSKCGTQNVDAARFCRECGTQLKSSENPAIGRENFVATCSNQLPYDSNGCVANDEYRAAFSTRVTRKKRISIIINIGGSIFAALLIVEFVWGMLHSDTIIDILEDPLYFAIYLGTLYLVLICVWVPIIICLMKVKKQQRDTVPFDIPEGDIRRTITIVRKKSMYGAAAPIMCFVNEHLVGSLKNGKNCFLKLEKEASSSAPNQVY